MQSLKQHFLSPEAAYTPFPFWFWNDALERDEIVRQIHDFKNKGIDGFIIHPRMGIPRETPYLSDEYFVLVRVAVAEAKALDMRVILYDEGMYPSGSACGRVVAENAAFASRGIRLAFLEDGKLMLDPSDEPIALVALRMAGDNAYDRSSARVIKDARDACGKETVVAIVMGYTHGTIRGIHPGQDDGEPDAPPSTDLLNEDAIACFIRLTHDKYHRHLKEYFGSTVIAMFTDEPNIMGRGRREHTMFPWTPGFAQEYEASGLSLADLPALFLNAGTATEGIRRDYQRAVYKRMNRTFYAPLSRWCASHGIALTGHPESSEDIGLLSFFQIPGQDIVWRWVAPESDLGVSGVHSTAAKCASDAARHLGRPRNASEVFGCCGPGGNHWSLPPDDIKWYLDHLFVRGCNLIIPHAFYYSLRTEMQYAERPPDVGPGNIWWPHYKQVADYIKRMSMLMTGVNQTQLAVLTSDEHLPHESVRALYERQIEFNYLCRSALFAATMDSGFIRIENQAYRALLVEDETLLESDVVQALEPFVNGGGTVIKVGGLTPDEVAAAALSCVSPAVRVAPAQRDLRMTHVALDGVHLILLVNEGDAALAATLDIALNGRPELWDAFRAVVAPARFARDGGRTLVPFALGRRESLVVAVSGGLRLPKPTPVSRREGVLTYAISFDWPDDGIAWLNLGDVRDLAEVDVNGVYAGATLWKPHALDIPVKAGKNSLIVHVRESKANTYGTPVPAGIMGCIEIY